MDLGPPPIPPMSSENAPSPSHRAAPTSRLALEGTMGRKLTPSSLKLVCGGRGVPIDRPRLGSTKGIGYRGVLPLASHKSLPQRWARYLGPKGPVKPAGNRQVTQWKPEGPGSPAGAHRALPKGLCWTGCAHSVRRGVLWGAATGSRWELGRGSDDSELCLRLVLEGWGLSPGRGRARDGETERESGAR